MQTGQNVLKLLGQYPKATKSLVVVGIFGVLGLTNLKLNSQTKTVQSSLDFEVPTLPETQTEKSEIKVDRSPDCESGACGQLYSRVESKSNRIDQIERRLLELENGLTQPQTNMEIFAVKLCEHHGGNNPNSEVNPCLETKYFKRQAEALKPFYEDQINNCLSVGKGNACLDPKTYQDDKKESPRRNGRRNYQSFEEHPGFEIPDASPKRIPRDDIAVGICKIIFNPKRCK